MRAAVLSSIPGELSILDVELAEPVGREVVVRVAASGLCHSDLHTMQGSLDCPVPAVLGHEVAGVVEATGPGVSLFGPGDRVVACLSVYCGECRRCQLGEPFLCEAKASTQRGADQLPASLWPAGPLYQYANIGGFAERVLVHENALVGVRDEMPLDRAALIGCAVTTGAGAVLNSARVRPGDSVAVIGCGGIGLNAVQGARLAGAGRIFAIDVNPSKLELARRFGATDLVDASRADPTEVVPAASGGRVDAAFEAVGLKATVEAAFAMTRPGGTAYAIGVVPAGTSIEIAGPQLLSGRGLRGVFMGSNRFRVDIPHYVDLYLQGRLLLDELISDRIGLDDIGNAYAALEAGEVARSVVVFDGPR